MSFMCIIFGHLFLYEKKGWYFKPIKRCVRCGFEVVEK